MDVNKWLILSCDAVHDGRSAGVKPPDEAIVTGSADQVLNGARHGEGGDGAAATVLPHDPRGAWEGV